MRFLRNGALLCGVYMLLKRARQLLAAAPAHRLWFNPHAQPQTALILSQLASIHQPYRPTFWMSHCYLQLLVLVLRGWFYSWWRPGRFEREILTLADGGSVSIDVLCDDLPASAPLVIILHTITGSSKSCTSLAQYASARGWRACVFNRRGHDQLLTSARFNLMGDVNDTIAMTNRIQTRYPGCFMVG